MSTKVLFGGDAHKRHTDITTIEGYVACTIAVQTSLMKEIRDRQIDYFCHLGDWYDRGYASDIASCLADCDLDIQMSNLLKGNFYGVIGNHIRLNLDSNPELHLIQPHPILKSRRPVLRQEQIIKTPEFLRIGDVQISFMHHIEDTEDLSVYKATRQPWAKYHIALYHTAAIIPNRYLLNTTHSYNATSNSTISELLEGVDFAIVGHVHEPLGQFVVETQTGSTIMCVPGSLTNVNTDERTRHSKVNLPLVTIDDDSNVTIEYIPFDLHTNMVTFKKKNVEESREKLRSLRGKPVDSLVDTVTAVASMTCGEEELSSLNAFMKAKGYTVRDRKLVRAVIDDPENLGKLLEIYKGEE